jgi:hypothetical protein
LKSSNALDNKGLPPANLPRASRWARASREQLEALATETDATGFRFKALDALRASCPPLRTEAEVAAEALAILRDFANDGQPGTLTYLHGDTRGDRLRALAKEPTR